MRKREGAAWLAPANRDRHPPLVSTTLPGRHELGQQHL
jgi:hypothetical protein